MDAMVIRAQKNLVDELKPTREGDSQYWIFLKSMCTYYVRFKDVGAGMGSWF
jgi:hypothetical protein